MYSTLGIHSDVIKPSVGAERVKANRDPPRYALSTLVLNLLYSAVLYLQGVFFRSMMMNNLSAPRRCKINFPTQKLTSQHRMKAVRLCAYVSLLRKRRPFIGMFAVVFICYDISEV